MGAFQMTNDSLYTANNAFSFKNRFNISHFCPRNENDIHLSLEWIAKTTKLDWAIVFLGIGGGYLKYSEVFRFAFEQFDDNSDNSIENLALMNYEDNPDYKASDLIIQTLIKDIDDKTWALAFLRLFFSVLKWFCNYIPITLNDYQVELEDLCYDFDELNIDDKNVSFPYLSVCDIVQDLNIKDELRIKYEIAANKYLNIINNPKEFKKEIEALMDAVYVAWSLNDNK